jgi:RNA polymerase sigma-B factor
MPRSVCAAPTNHVLLRRYARQRRPADLEELVRRFQPLARGLARRYRLRAVPRDDLEQAAYLGLVKALRGFDPDLGRAFSTYAVPTILGEIRRQCRASMWAAHVPRLVQERVRLVRQTADQLRAQLGRSPRVREIAARLECDEEIVVESLTAAAALGSVSLDRPSAREDEDRSSVVEALGHEDPGFEFVECRATIEDALTRLDDDERLVLRLRYADERTFAEIGQELALGPAEAARLARRSLDHLRALTNDAEQRIAA